MTQTDEFSDKNREPKTLKISWITIPGWGEKTYEKDPNDEMVVWIYGYTGALFYRYLLGKFLSFENLSNGELLVYPAYNHDMCNRNNKWITFFNR